MTKREEIREGIKNKLFTILGKDNVGRTETDLDGDVEYILSYLHSQGVVIKVERELSFLPLLESNRHKLELIAEGYYKAQQDMLKAGYVAIEPLIIK